MKWFGPKLKVNLGIALVVGMCLVALFADVLAPHDPYVQNLARRLRPPVWADRGSWAYPLGTDNFGRDLLSRLIYGSRLSITVGLLAMMVALTVGTVLGLLAGYLGGRIEQVIMRCLDADPARRPPSALAVSAALPGGDPLAAALAAGQTPSPEMVAAAGTAGTMSPCSRRAISSAIVGASSARWPVNSS